MDLDTYVNAWIAAKLASIKDDCRREYFYVGGAAGLQGMKLEDANRLLEPIFIHVFTQVDKTTRKLNWRGEKAEEAIEQLIDTINECARDYDNALKVVRRGTRRTWRKFLRDLQADLQNIRFQVDALYRMHDQSLYIGEDLAHDLIDPPCTVRNALIADVVRLKVDVQEAQDVRACIRLALASEGTNPMLSLAAISVALERVTRLDRQRRQFAGDYEAAIALLDETTSEVERPQPTKDEPEPQVDFTRELLRIEAQLEHIEPRIGKLHDISLDMVDWLEEVEEEASEHFERQRLLSEASRHAAIDAQERAFGARIAEIREQHANIEAELGTLTRARDVLRRQRDAIRIVQDGMAPVHLPEGAPHAAELPDLQTFLDSLGDYTVGDEAEDSGAAPEDAELHTVHGLPYTVSYTTADIRMADEYAQWLRSFAGKDQEYVRAHIPFRSDSGLDEVYHGLIEQLIAGQFAESLMMALIVLNAMRRGDELVPRASKNIGTSMYRRGVKLANSLSHAAPATGAATKVSVLGESCPTRKLITRVNIGSRWGTGNRLDARAQVLAQVWTMQALESGSVTCEQLCEIHRAQQEADRKAAKKAAANSK